MSSVKDFGKFGTIGIEIALSATLGYFAGSYLGHRYHISYLKWCGFALGVFSGFWQLMKLSNEHKKQLEREEAALLSGKTKRKIK